MSVTRLQQEAEQIVNNLLADDSPKISACAWCEKEHGILDRRGFTKTHGLCERHMIEMLREGGVPDADIANAISKVRSFPPDLGPVHQSGQNPSPAA